MISMGRGDTGFNGKDPDEKTSRIQQWNDVMDEIDKDYNRKINSFIDTIEC